MSNSAKISLTRSKLLWTSVTRSIQGANRS